MLLAGWWGLVAGPALLLGAVLGAVRPGRRPDHRARMGFGAGVLMSAVAFELTLESFEGAGHLATITGLAAGGLTFFVGDWLIDAWGGHRRKSPTMQTHASAGGASVLVLGAMLDGIPESAAASCSWPASPRPSC